MLLPKSFSENAQEKMDSEKKYNSYVPHLCYKGGNTFSFPKKPHQTPPKTKKTKTHPQKTPEQKPNT